MFQFELNGREETIDAPTAEDIVRVITSLNPKDSALLLQDEGTYMQVMVTNNGVILEHQAGSIEDFFAAPVDVSPEEVLAAFVAYHAENDSWKSDLSWEHVNPDEFNLDFTVLTSVPEETLTDGQEVDFEGHLELPYIAVFHWLTLYHLLCGGDLEEMEEEFMVLCEAESETEDRIYIYPAPGPLCVALEQLASEDVPQVAQRWVESEEFPRDEIAPHEAESLLREIAEMAREAAAQSYILLICELDLGGEEDDFDGATTDG